MIDEGWGAPFDDPSFYLLPLFGSDGIPKNGFDTNLSYFDDPAVSEKLSAAAELPAPAHFTALGNLDVQIVRKQAPIVAYYGEPAAYVLVSKRIGCVTYNPVWSLDYAALCLRK